MKKSDIEFLLFNWDNIDGDIINDPSELTVREFRELVERDGNGHVYNLEEFESAFNAEKFSTATHQLKIVIKK